MIKVQSTGSVAGWSMWALAVAALVTTSCGSSGSNSGGDAVAKHQVYLVGYVYDGATGQQLPSAAISAMSIQYRDQVVHVKIEDDGRFVTTDPLPVWQDYSVYVAATGYRPFVSNNPGFDIPKALQMTEGASSKGTVQTFEYALRLFPSALQASKVTVTIEKADALISNPPPARAAGTLRLTPVSSPAVQQGPLTTDREWTNDQDLLTQTVTQAFTDGSATIPDGALIYGVSYQISIFGVDGYQPFPGGSTTTSSVLTAGAVTSLSLTLQPDLKAPLRILGTDADKCTPPMPTTNAYGATIDITFSEPIEPGGPTFAEDVDNGVSITVPTSTSTSTCPLNTSVDPTKQERGTKATISGKVLTLSFNPAVGLATITPYGTTCAIPTSLTAVVYSLSNVFVQPVGDPVRKASVGTLLSQTATYPATGTTSASCPFRTTTSNF
ncbi:MAG TPA: hypothetical protein VHO67_10915 [Polyangia bacterium]|nr:hypothetical protein [Polyangia bacterium]